MNPLSVVVRTVCDLFAWFMIVFGVNVLLHGYVTPGGGFQGGAIIATFIAFLLVAYGGRRVASRVNDRLFDLFEEVGLLVFFILAFLGLPVTFFFNFLAKPLAESAGGFIPGVGTVALMSVAVGLEVTGALSLIILTMHRGFRMFWGVDLEPATGQDR